MYQTSQVKEKRTPVLYKDYGDFSIHYGNRDNRDRLVSVNISSHPWVEEVRREFNQGKPDFNAYQYWLFRRALFGSEVYSSEEWNWLHPWKRERILGLQKKAEDVLSRWRQELVIGISDKIIDILIQGTRGSNWNPETGGDQVDKIKKNLECSPDDDFTCTFTLTDLKITKRMVAEKLVQTRVLPKRFFEMDVEDDPRFILLSSREEVKLD